MRAWRRLPLGILQRLVTKIALVRPEFNLDFSQGNVDELVTRLDFWRVPCCRKVIGLLDNKDIAEVLQLVQYYLEDDIAMSEFYFVHESLIEESANAARHKVLCRCSCSFSLLALTSSARYSFQALSTESKLVCAHAYLELLV